MRESDHICMCMQACVSVCIKNENSVCVHVRMYGHVLYLYYVDKEISIL